MMEVKGNIKLFFWDTRIPKKNPKELILWSGRQRSLTKEKKGEIEPPGDAEACMELQFPMCKEDILNKPFIGPDNRTTY